jgi:hypothetical protein
MRGLGILLALMFALLASGCGGSEPTAEQVPPDAIVLAASKTNEAGTYKADITGTMDIAGQSIDMSGTGEFDGAQQRGHMSYTMTLNGQHVDMEMVFSYPAIYMRLPPELAPLPDGKSWVKMDLEKLGQQAGFDFGQVMQAGQSDPSQGLDLLRGATDVQAVGDEDVRGVATTHYTGVVDLPSLGTKYPEMKPSIDQLVEQSGISRVPVEVWIDGDGFVRRMKQTLEGAGAGLGMQLDMTMTTELYDFGTDVSVEEPAPSEVADFGELLGQN